MSDQTTSLKLPVTITRYRNISRDPWYDAHYVEPTGLRTLGGSGPTKAEALASLEAKIHESLGDTTPILVVAHGWVAVAFHEPGMGWTYYLTDKPEVDRSQLHGIVYGQYTREECARRMRSHLASCITGTNGASVILHPEDLDDYWASETWQAGCRLWQDQHELTWEQVRLDHALDNAMREVADRTRSQYRHQRHQEGQAPPEAYLGAVRAIGLRLAAGDFPLPRDRSAEEAAALVAGCH